MKINSFNPIFLLLNKINGFNNDFNISGDLNRKFLSIFYKLLNN